jgi:hypothetical protein
MKNAVVSIQGHLFKKIHKLLDEMDSSIERIENHLVELDKLEEETPVEGTRPKLRLVK